MGITLSKPLLTEPIDHVLRSSQHFERILVGQMRNSTPFTPGAMLLVLLFSRWSEGEAEAAHISPRSSTGDYEVPFE